MSVVLFAHGFILGIILGYAIGKCDCKKGGK